MKKYILTILVVLLCVSKPVFAIEESFESLNWTFVKSDIEVKLIDGRSYVPIRQLSNVIDGMGVAYDNEQNTVFVSFKDAGIEMSLDSSIMIRHKGLYRGLILDPVAKIKSIGGVTYVPIRVVADYTDIAVIYQNGYLYIADTAKKVSVEPTKTSISEYVNGNYSVCSTVIGDIKLDINVKERLLFSDCYDFEINARRDMSWSRARNNTNSKNDIKKAQEQLKEHMKILAEDLVSKLPSTRLIGSYDESGYTYPNIKVDYNKREFCRWKNFKCGAKCGVKDEPSGFRWEEYSKDLEY